MGLGVWLVPSPASFPPNPRASRRHPAACTHADVRGCRRLCAIRARVTSPHCSSPPGTHPTLPDHGSQGPPSVSQGAPSRHNTTRPSSVLAGGDHSTHPLTPIFHPPPGPARLARLSPPVVVTNPTDELLDTSTGPSQSSDCAFSPASLLAPSLLLCLLVSSRPQFGREDPVKALTQTQCCSIKHTVVAPSAPH